MFVFFIHLQGFWCLLHSFAFQILILFYVRNESVLKNSFLFIALKIFILIFKRESSKYYVCNAESMYYTLPHALSLLI